MRALLVNVPAYGSHLRGIPLGLLYIISSARAAGRQVDLLDGSLYGSRQAFEREFLSADHDVVGLSAMTHNIGEAQRLAGLLRKARPGTRVIVGGVHASTVPEEVLGEFPGCDVLSGEGEESFVRYLDAVEGRASFAEVGGLFRLADGATVSNPVTPIEELDALPFPAYDMIDFSNYTVGVHGLFFKRKPLTSIVTSRGCPFKCSFCAKTSMTGYTWRPRSASNVLDEIEILTREYGVREIHFEDDNIALDQGRFRDMCEGIIERGLDITWKCPHGIYASHLDAGMFSLMKKSGCYSLSFGVESGNDELLKKAGKASDTAGIRRAIEAAHRAGISTTGFFIFGLEGETKETIRQTIDFAKSLPLDWAQFNLCVPFKGTAIRERYLEMGYIGEDDLASYDVDHAVLDLPGLSAKTLKRLRLRAFIEFYSRPSVMMRNLKSLSSPDIIKALFYRVRNIWRA